MRGDHTLFLQQEGSISACGYNYYGQLGMGNQANQSTPQPLARYQKIAAFLQKLKEKTNRSSALMNTPNVNPATATQYLRLNGHV